MNFDLREYMEQFHMVKKGDLILIGVSGGADSVCLLLLLHEIAGQAGCLLRVLHVEHGIRGEESLEDARFVEGLCHRLQVPVQVISVDVPEYAGMHHMGWEEAARKLRYEAFDRAAVKAAKEGWEPCRIKIALAHHMEDNAETILFQMLRGSGITGLCGMQPVRQHERGYFFIRPLLFLQRQQIEFFLKEREQKYRTDATNQDVTYARNRLRNRVFPEFVQINGQAVAHMNDTAVRLSEIQDYLMEQTCLEMERLVSCRDGKYRVDIPGLLELHPALQKELLKQVLYRKSGRKKDIAAVHVEQLIRLAENQSGRKLSLPYGMKAVREYDKLILEAAKRQNTAPDAGGERDCGITVSSGILEEGKSSGKEWRIVLEPDQELVIRIFPMKGFSGKITKKTYTKWLDYDKIKGGFIIRKRKSGDYFCMDDSGHRKKLKQYMTDEKIPASKRQQMWLLAMESQVIWLIGGRISEDCKVSEQTSYVAEFSYRIGGVVPA